MKTIAKGTEPLELEAYRQRFSQQPTPPKWKDFKKSASRRDPVVLKLHEDQGGICAYCEIDLISEDQSVEHFVPANQTTRAVDWDLRWSNLLLICKGGTDSSLHEEGEYRYARPPGNDACCGGSKLGSVDPILDPTAIHPHACVFKVGMTSGELSPDDDVCARFGIDPNLAASSITLLNLNCSRLSRNRLAIINELLEEAQTSEDAEIARNHIVRDTQHCWPPFFSTYRSFLGEAAENHLAQLPCYP